MRLADVAGPDTASQTKLSLVAPLDYLLDIGERDGGDHRTEYLLLRNPHVVAYVRENRGWDEITSPQGPVGQPLTAGQRTRTLLPAHVEVAGHARELFFRNQRSDLSVRIAPIADPQCFAERGDAADELLVDLVLDKQPGAGAADLPGIGENRHAGARNSLVQVGVGEYDIR